jgi:hypothetical protein
MTRAAIFLLALLASAPALAHDDAPAGRYWLLLSEHSWNGMNSYGFYATPDECHKAYAEAFKGWKRAPEHACLRVSPQ